MKALKIAGVVFAAIAVLVIIAIAVVASRFDGERIKSEAVRLAMEKKQRTLRIDGPLSLSFFPNVGINIGKVSLSEHESDEEFASFQSARVSVALMPLLSKRIVINDVRLDGLKAALVKYRSGNFNIADLTAHRAADSAPAAPAEAPDAKSLAGELQISGIAVTHAALAWRDEQTGSALAISGLDLHTGAILVDGASKALHAANVALQVQGTLENGGAADTFDVKLTAPKLDISPEASTGDPIGIVATLTGARHNATLNLALSPLQGTGGRLHVDKLSADFTAAQGDQSVKGQLATGVSFDLDRQTLNLEKIACGFIVNDPQLPTKLMTLSVSGDVAANLTRKSAEGSLEVQADETRTALKFDLSSFAPLALKFAVDIDKFNLDRYLPPQKAPAHAAAAPAAAAAAPQQPIDFSPIKGLAVDGSVRVGQLQAHNVKVGELQAQLHIGGNRLELTPVSARLYEGSLTGSVGIDADHNALSIRQTLAGVQVGPLLKDAADLDMIDGHGDVALNVTTSGRTPDEFRKALAGAASFTFKDGAIKGINLAQTLRDLEGKIGAAKDQTVASQSDARTDFSELSASFKIAGGVAHNDDLTGKSPFLRLGGNGDIDIGAGRLDYLVKASVVASTGGQGGEDLGKLKGITVPVRMTGTFEQPSWRIEFADLGKELVRAKIQENQQAVKDQLKDQLQNKLKSLFPH